MFSTRQLYARRVKRRSTLIAIVSTLAVAGLLYVLIPLSPGWEAVKKSFFDGEIFIKSFPALLNAFLIDIA